jgi:hypothetical protein
MAKNRHPTLAIDASLRSKGESPRVKARPPTRQSKAR